MFPALALGTELMARGHELVMLTDERGARIIEGASGNLKVVQIPAAAFYGTSLGKKIKAVGAYFRGKARAKNEIAGFGPHAVIGAGGYASFPLIRAAQARHVPYFLVEQNSVPGRVTRMTAKRAEMVFTGIPLVTEIKGKTVFTGNVLRKSVVIESRTEGSKVLVLGGSAGARRLNYLGYELAKKMPDQRFVLLSGDRDYDEIAAKSKLANLELVAFTQHPEELYRQAKVAVSRAGAISISELMVNGIPSILIPFPFAIDDHQTHNARWARDAGAAVFLPQTEISSVHKVLKELLDDPHTRTRMSEAGHKLIPRNASTRIAERIEECLAG